MLQYAAQLGHLNVVSFCYQCGHEQCRFSTYTEALFQRQVLSLSFYTNQFLPNLHPARQLSDHRFSGRTPLHNAERNGHMVVVKV